MLCENEELKLLALALYIWQTKETLLIESEPFYMSFDINKDVTLRSLLGNDRFALLINKTVDLLSNQDRINCIVLLDKSK